MKTNMKRLLRKLTKKVKQTTLSTILDITPKEITITTVRKALFKEAFRQVNFIMWLSQPENASYIRSSLMYNISLYGADYYDTDYVLRNARDEAFAFEDAFYMNDIIVAYLIKYALLPSGIKRYDKMKLYDYVDCMRDEYDYDITLSDLIKDFKNNL